MFPVFILLGENGPALSSLLPADSRKTLDRRGPHLHANSQIHIGFTGRRDALIRYLHAPTILSSSMARQEGICGIFAGRCHHRHSGPFWFVVLVPLCRHRQLAREILPARRSTGPFLWKPSVTAERRSDCRATSGIRAPCGACGTSNRVVLGDHDLHHPPRVSDCGCDAAPRTCGWATGARSDKKDNGVVGRLV
jgi:hypothetical protein